LDSTFISPRVWLIPSLVSTGKLAEAKEHYQYLLRLKPQANNFESAMIDWVGAFLAADYDRQAYYLRVALLSSKDNRILLDNLAYAEQSLGHYTAAVDAMQPCLRSKWRYAPMYRTVGECLLKIQDIQRAKSILNDALGNAWVDIRVAPMLTAIYKKEGDEANAERFQQTTLKAYKERTGTYGLGYERIAGYLLDVGLLDSAEAAIQKALDENPRVATHHGQYAEILLRQGRLPDAEQQCYQAMLLDSTYGITHFLLGQVFDKKGDRSDAVRQYNQFLTFDSTSYEAQITRQALSRIQR
jgi:tetratricopeptide (TPR) repeat protein